MLLKSNPKFSDTAIVVFPASAEPTAPMNKLITGAAVKKINTAATNIMNMNLLNRKTTFNKNAPYFTNIFVISFFEISSFVYAFVKSIGIILMFFAFKPFAAATP